MMFAVGLPIADDAISPQTRYFDFQLVITFLQGIGNIYGIRRFPLPSEVLSIHLNLGKIIHRAKIQEYPPLLKLFLRKPEMIGIGGRSPEILDSSVA